MSRGSDKSFVGRVDGESVWLRKRSSFGISPFFQPRLVARFEASDTGTNLEGKFRANPFLWVFLAALPVVFVVPILFFALMAVAGAPTGPNKDYAIAFWLPLVMVSPLLLVTGGVVAYVRHRTREDRPPLTEFLARTLDAETVTRH